MGSEIMAMIKEEGFDELDAPPVRITGSDNPMPYAKNLEKASLPQVECIVKKVTQICS